MGQSSDLNLNEGNDKPEYNFHVSGSQYVNVVKGKADFSLNHKTSIKIDKECHENSLSYQLIFVLCEIEKLSSPIKFISSTPFVVYPGSPKNNAIETSKHTKHWQSICTSYRLIKALWYAL